MCSIEEDLSAESCGQWKDCDIQVSKQGFGRCCKCGLTGFVVKTQFRGTECKECFLIYAKHKFRATLGSSKVMPKNSKVLIFFDGSSEGVMLLDMMHNLEDQKNSKSFSCIVQVLYLDQIHLVSNKTQHKEKLVGIANILKAFDSFDIFIAPFEAIKEPLPTFNEIDAYLAQEFDDVNYEIKDNLNNILTVTSQEDYIKHKRNKFLAAACIQLHCDFVFLPDISPNLAIQLLTDIALGRGGSAPLDVSLIDDRFLGTKLVRPLKDFDEIEVMFYLQIRNLQSVVAPIDDNITKPSLQQLTKAFVQGLQKNCPSTVSTVFRLGGKISPNKENSPQMIDSKNHEEGQEKFYSCIFCNTGLDFSKSNTIFATEFSQAVSELGSSVASFSSLETIIENKYKCKNQTKELSERLCHGCCNILNDYQSGTLESRLESENSIFR